MRELNSQVSYSYESFTLKRRKKPNFRTTFRNQKGKYKNDDDNDKKNVKYEIHFKCLYKMCINFDAVVFIITFFF